MFFYCDLQICSGWLNVTAFLNFFMCWSRFGKNSISQASQFFNNINLHIYKLFIWNFRSHPLLHSNMFNGILMHYWITVFFFWYKNIVNLIIFFLLDLSLNINNIGQRTSLILSFNVCEYSPAKNGTVSTPIYPKSSVLRSLPCYRIESEQPYSSDKRNYIDIFSEIQNLEEHLNHCIGSKVTAIFTSRWILPTGGVASERVCPAACAAGLLIF